MSNEEQTGAASGTRKRRGMWLVGVAALLVLGGCGYMWQMHKGTRAEASRQQEGKSELYLPMDPPFVVNFRDGDSLRYLQVAVTLMSHDPQVIEAAKSADPVIRDALVSLFSNQEYAVISNAAGRRQLQQQALAAARKVVQARLGRPGIDALYFTSFVMQ